jgi:hypothetical protein
LKFVESPLTQEIVQELLDYDPLTGVLTWKERDCHWFKSDRDCRGWNIRFSGKPAFTAVETSGYFRGRILGKCYKAARIIWLWMTGNFPVEEIGHKDHDRLNNKWENLQDASPQENRKNQIRYITNSSGRTGVLWHKRDRKWCAQIRVGGRNHHLGYYADYDEACAARAAAELEYGFSPGHGQPRGMAA